MTHTQQTQDADQSNIMVEDDVRSLFLFRAVFILTNVSAYSLGMGWQPRADHSRGERIYKLLSKAVAQKLKETIYLTIFSCSKIAID